jgi:iron complex outermembrane recepter protein
MRNIVLPQAAVCLLGVSICEMSTSHAQGVAQDHLLETVTVSAMRQSNSAEQPAVIVSQSAEDLRTQNLVNPEDALRYAPSLTIRKRYIGDRNALIGGRSSSTQQAPRGLLLMDGYLLSNFLGRFDAPRWNMIAVEEIERIDILYGPFSAIYPGNSIGTTIVVKTQRPDMFHASARVIGFAQQFEEYNFEETYKGYELSGYLGDRFDNGSWFSLSANHQDSISHPMQYYTISANAAGAFPNVTAAAIPVSGVVFDTDPNGRRRAVFGANAGAIDHTLQNQFKLRGGYDFNDWLQAEGFVALWENNTQNDNRNFMRDTAGNLVYPSATSPVIVSANGIAFSIPVNAFVPSSRDEQHMQWGTTLRTANDTGWNGSLVYSQYEIRKDIARTASLPDPIAANGGNGTLVFRDGTQWKTFELQGTYTPIDSDWSGGAHTLAFGYHRNAYELLNPTYNVNNWQSDTITVAAAQNVFGKTGLQALYAQDQWRFADAWILTLGLRYEDWKAHSGGQISGTAQQRYADREQRATSPKLSLGFMPTAHWSLRASAARGVRFPTVAELFQGSTTANAIIANDPNLKPERSNALDLTTEYRRDLGSLRISLYQDDVRDTIFNQTNILVTPNITNVQNIDRVRTRGVETAFTVHQLGLESLRVQGNLAYARAIIVANNNFPTSINKVWPRVPNWRGSLQLIWQPNETWLSSLGARYSGRIYNTLDNSDINPDVYGGTSRFTFVDARLVYTFIESVELAVGIDNLFDRRGYQSHPYPGRTGSLEVRWKQ